jgi:hypothetical protein
LRFSLIAIASSSTSVVNVLLKFVTILTSFANYDIEQFNTSE